MRFLVLRVLTCTALACASFAAFAQKSPPPPKQAPQAKQELKMETVHLIILIKSTMMALQHANQTGNYSVLRDLGSPIFRERFDQAKLTAIFANFRARGLDLNSVLVLPPNLAKQPELNGNELHLAGNFATQPLPIQYDMLFLYLDGVWRLNGLAVDAMPVQFSTNGSVPPVASGSSLAGAVPFEQAQPQNNASGNIKGDKKAANLPSF